MKNLHMVLYIKVCFKNIQPLENNDINVRIILIIDSISTKPNLLRMSSKEKLPHCTTSLIVTVISPQISPANSDDISEETKPEYLRRTNSSSSIATLGMCVIKLL